jgi:hypothetical protein
LNSWVKERVVGSSPLAPKATTGERGDKDRKAGKRGGTAAGRATAARREHDGTETGARQKPRPHPPPTQRPGEAAGGAHKSFLTELRSKVR